MHNFSQRFLHISNNLGTIGEKYLKYFSYKGLQNT